VATSKMNAPMPTGMMNHQVADLEIITLRTAVAVDTITLAKETQFPFKFNSMIKITNYK
jgi:hypothetical protein